jgi:hypothetical protein
MQRTQSFLLFRQTCFVLGSRSCGEAVHKQKYSISQVRDTAQTRASDNFVIQLDVIDIDSGSRGSPFTVKFYSGIFSLVIARQTLKPRYTKFSQVWNNMERVHNRGAYLDCKCIESTLVFKLDTKTSPWMIHHHSYTNEKVVPMVLIPSKSQCLVGNCVPRISRGQDVIHLQRGSFPFPTDECNSKKLISVHFDSE